jgi:4-amino-4-deoxy-L-arabinose transferase-like glycosyltransferase
MKKRTVLQILAACLLAYLAGIFCVPLMDWDATQYASMSREMLQSGNYLQVQDHGKDYLDKPPMLFWLSSSSLYLFGIHDWAYRIPSFLFSVLTFYSTYRLALLFYKKEIAVISVLVLVSCQAMFLMNHDVRTDTMLTGWVTFSIWQLAAWYQHNKWKNLLLAAIAIAGGMMTKGPLALMIPVFAFVPHLALKRNWGAFVRWQYIPMLIIIALLLVPMSIGLYQQYDIQPGKMVSGNKIDSGLRFFYWTQSFGRITGESTVKENVTFFFLLQNMLWSFLPWILFFLLGLFAAIKNIIQKRFLLTGNEEAITSMGFVITYCALGSSQAQLPHYIFVVFPLAAIITADFLYGLLYSGTWKKWLKPLFAVHSVIFSLMWTVLIFLLTVPFKDIPLYAGILAGCFFAVFIFLVFSKSRSFPKLLAICLFTSIGLNIFLNSFFYPALLKYQKGNIAARYINDNRLPKEKLFIFGESGHALFFYGGYLFKVTNNTEELSPGSYLVISKRDYDEQFKNKPATIVFSGKSFHVSMLTLRFINPATRDTELIPFYIARIN